MTGIIGDAIPADLEKLVIVAEFLRHPLTRIICLLSCKALHINQLYNGPQLLFLRPASVQGSSNRKALRSSSTSTLVQYRASYRLSRVVAITVAAQATTMTSLPTGEALKV
jgi:hypothetical protein